jgi:hypothetical protein
VHFLAISFKETAATSDEQRVTSEDPSRMVLVDLVSDVVADGVLGVARGGKAPGSMR